MKGLKILDLDLNYTRCSDESLYLLASAVKGKIKLTYFRLNHWKTKYIKVIKR